MTISRLHTDIFNAPFCPLDDRVATQHIRRSTGPYCGTAHTERHTVEADVNDEARLRVAILCTPAPAGRRVVQGRRPPTGVTYTSVSPRCAVVRWRNIEPSNSFRNNGVRPVHRRTTARSGIRQLAKPTLCCSSAVLPLHSPAATTSCHVPVTHTYTRRRTTAQLHPLRGAFRTTAGPASCLPWFKGFT